MNINWYPGHMEKTYRQMKEALKRVEFVLEVCDARCARSTRNPELAELTAHKDRLLLLNKSDLADPAVTAAWLAASEGEGVQALATDLHRQADIGTIRAAIRASNRERTARAKAKGYVAKPLKLMVVGIPNSGKSTLINRLAGKRSLKTQNRPGVTRQLVWLRAGTDFELLDTPGVLWPKLATADAQFALAASGAIPDDILPLQAVAGWLLNRLRTDYPDELARRFGTTALGSLEALAFEQKLLLGGGEADLTRTATRLLNDFRSGQLGRFSLERP